jgi:BASS family bile acid:Na+ symporter
VALLFMGHSFLKNFAFTVWVFAFVSASLFFNEAFLELPKSWVRPLAGFELKLLIVPLIQIITFGMGTTLSLADFSRIFKMPWPVLVALVAHFFVMPMTGFALAKVFACEGAVAAGIVLIGSCPSGVASNVMTYLAGGNVALAVTITSCSTLLAPLLTPFLMYHLAGSFVEVKLAVMMLDIINMIIVPIAAGLIAHQILYGRGGRCNRGSVLAALGAVCVGAAVVLALFVRRDLVHVWGTTFQKDGLVVGLALVGLVTLAKLVVRVWLNGPEKWMDKALPLVSMLAICSIIAVITATAANDLFKVGPLLIVVTIIHNGVGYLFGYWISRLVGLEESWCRTVAFEVGMQNGGMASALAIKTLHSAPAALAPAIFGPWQNVSGSILASLWRRRPPADAAQAKPREVAMSEAAR